MAIPSKLSVSSCSRLLAVTNTSYLPKIITSTHRELVTRVVSFHKSGLFEHLSKLPFEQKHLCKHKLNHFRFQFQRNFRSKRTQPNRHEQVKDKNTKQEDIDSKINPYDYYTGEPVSHLKRFLFMGTVVTGSFLSAMICQYENWRSSVQNKMSNQRLFDSFEVPQKRVSLRQYLNEQWTKLDKSVQISYVAIAMNCAVFGLWSLKIPAVRNVMTKFFVTSNCRPVSSMLLASFSHINFFHLFCNMYVFMNFGKEIGNIYGVEQGVAFYLSTGTFASFVSITANSLLKRNVASVGASGAIMGILGVLWAIHPDERLHIIFIDTFIPHSFSVDTAMKVMVCVDALGLALGWRVMDHACHLGGVLFGLLYAKYGHNLIWGSRESVMKRWHAIRGKP